MKKTIEKSQEFTKKIKKYVPIFNFFTFSGSAKHWNQFPRLTFQYNIE